MEILVIKKPITKAELSKIAKAGFGDMIKAVVDTEQGIMAIGGEFHAEEEVVLSEQEGTKRENAWGVNLHPEKPEKEWIVFDSMVNIKPQHNNRSRKVEDEAIQEKIRVIVTTLILN